MRWFTLAVVVGAIAVAGCGSDAESVVAPDAVGDVTTTGRALVTTAPSGVTESVEVVEEQQDLPEVFGVDETIRFDPGGTSATISGGVVRGERNRYTLEAAAGQTMNITVVSVEDNAVFDVFGPGDVQLATETTAASIVLPTNGVYTLVLGSGRGNASYDLTVEIPVS